MQGPRNFEHEALLVYAPPLYGNSLAMLHRAAATSCLLGAEETKYIFDHNLHNGRRTWTSNLRDGECVGLLRRHFVVVAGMVSDEAFFGLRKKGLAFQRIVLSPGQTITLQR